MNESIRDLETRVRRLERTNRWLMISCVALAGLPMLLAAGAQDQPKPKPLPPGPSPMAPAPLPESVTNRLSKELQDMLKADQEIHNVLRARVLALVDKNGKTKAVLSTDNHGDPVLCMFGVTNFGKDDYLALTLGLNANYAQCVFNDPSEKPRVGLYSYGGDREPGPELLMGGGGRIHMKHDNGTDLAVLKAINDSMDFHFTSKEGRTIMQLGSYMISGDGGRTHFRKSEFTMHSSERENTASIFAGPTMVSISVSVGGTKYGASMSAESQGIISGRCHEPMSGKDEVFSSKRMPRGSDWLNFWLADPKE